MSVISHNKADVKTLARLIRAEAEGEGVQGMLLVGNVLVQSRSCKLLGFQEYLYDQLDGVPKSWWL